jgi:hypothetical protein
MQRDTSVCARGSSRPGAVAALILFAALVGFSWYGVSSPAAVVADERHPDAAHESPAALPSPVPSCSPRATDRPDPFGYPAAWLDGISGLACAARVASARPAYQRHVASLLSRGGPETRFGTAVITECRVGALLDDLIEWMAFLLLPKGWGLILQHCTANAAQAEALRARLPAGALTLLPMARPALSWEEFTALMCSRPFWAGLPTELVLKYETDSVLLNYTAAERFFGYEYVGAPWRSMDMSDDGAGHPRHPPMPGGLDRDRSVGNSGFTIRSRAAMLRVIDASPPRTGG